MDISINDIRVGEKVIFGRNAQSKPISWIKVSKDNTFISEFCLGVMCWDATERGIYNSNYELSNVRQWLHSTERQWFSPSHPDDVCEARDRRVPGFLSEFIEEEVNAISEIELPDSNSIAGASELRYQYFRKHGVRAKYNAVTSSYETTLCRDTGTWGWPFVIGRDASIGAYGSRGGVRPVLKFVPGTKAECTDTGLVVYGSEIEFETISDDAFAEFIFS